jgi:THO complex subunit 4
MDRLGNGNSGTTITIQNLNPDIIPSDISELCVNIGEVKSVNMQYDSAGKATGRADVTFAKRSDALSCVQRFNNVELDGTKMDVKLAGETPPSGGAQTTNAPSFAARANPVRESSDGNVRNGLFGTAMVDLGDRGGEKRGANRNKERAYKEPSFTVNLGGNGNTGGNRVPRRDEHDDRGDDAMPQISTSSYPPRGSYSTLNRFFLLIFYDSYLI